jgi:hypothetical protein
MCRSVLQHEKRRAKNLCFKLVIAVMRDVTTMPHLAILRQTFSTASTPPHLFRPTPPSLSKTSALLRALDHFPVEVCEIFSVPKNDRMDDESDAHVPFSSAAPMPREQRWRHAPPRLPLRTYPPPPMPSRMPLQVGTRLGGLGFHAQGSLIVEGFIPRVCCSLIVEGFSRGFHSQGLLFAYFIVKG